MDLLNSTYWLVESSHVISKVTITTDDGTEIRGLIGSKPPHVPDPEERKNRPN